MAELYTFLDGAIADIRSKIDLEYQKRLAAHEKTISEELSAEDYTPDYGKINLVDALSHFYNEGHMGCPPPAPCKPQITKWVGTPPHATQSTKPATDTHPKGRWFVHYIPVITTSTSQGAWSAYNSGDSSIRTSYSYSITLIDNYGLTYHASSDHTTVALPYQASDHTTAGKKQAVSWRLEVDSVLSASTASYKHRLPNFLIDFCKKQTQNAFTGDSSQFLAAQYYKRFTAMKPLFTSGRFTDYESLLATKVSLDEQLATANTRLTDATTQIATLTTEAERTKAELRSEIEQLKAAMVTEAKKVADRELELRAQLEATNKEEIERYRVSEENYVSQLFQQRQEITSYKKQLLALDSVAPAPAPAPAIPSLEELIAQAVRKALEKPTLEVADL